MAPSVLATGAGAVGGLEVLPQRVALRLLAVSSLGLKLLKEATLTVFIRFHTNVCSFGCYVHNIPEVQAIFSRWILSFQFASQLASRVASC